MLYILRFFFSSKCSFFHNANLFGSCIIHILYTGCAKIKKNNSGAKGLICNCVIWRRSQLLCLYMDCDRVLNISSVSSEMILTEALRITRSTPWKYDYSTTMFTIILTREVIRNLAVTGWRQTAWNKARSFPQIFLREVGGNCIQIELT